MGRRKNEQKVIKDLLLSNQIDQVLLRIEQMIRNSYDFREKDRLTKFYTYISRNRQGIANQVKKNIRKKIKMYYHNLNKIRIIVLIYPNNKP